MEDIKDQKKIALLIDAENAQLSKLPLVLNELSTHGRIITRRAYADWQKESLKNWSKVLNELAIQPVQQNAYTTGKNSSDAALIIDAMDLLYSGQYDAFALVSSDSDFTKLASRLRESVVYVFGVGEKKTPVSFINACDNFILTENLVSVELQKDTSELSGAEDVPQEIVDLLITGWKEYKDEDNGDWANVGTTGALIKRVKPDFDVSTYNVSKLSELIQKVGVFELNSNGEGRGQTNNKYRKKQL